MPSHYIALSWLVCYFRLLSSALGITSVMVQVETSQPIAIRSSLYLRPHPCFRAHSPQTFPPFSSHFSKRPSSPPSATQPSPVFPQTCMPPLRPLHRTPLQSSTLAVKAPLCCDTEDSVTLAS